MYSLPFLRTPGKSLPLQPFFHILATAIAQQIGDEHPKQIIATTLVAYALSSILTGWPSSYIYNYSRLTCVGLSFLLLGALKLGAIVGFFPRHILVGYVARIVHSVDVLIYYYPQVYRRRRRVPHSDWVSHCSYPYCRE